MMKREKERRQILRRAQDVEREELQEREKKRDNSIV
jgi:hypothetical protein